MTIYISQKLARALKRLVLFSIYEGFAPFHNFHLSDTSSTREKSAHIRQGVWKRSPQSFWKPQVCKTCCQAEHAKDSELKVFMLISQHDNKRCKDSSQSSSNR